MVKHLNLKKTLKRKYKQKGGTNSDVPSLNKTVSNSKNLLNESVDKASAVITDVSKNIVKDISTNVENITDAMKGPEGEKLVQNLVQLTDTMKPVLDETAKIGNEFITEEAKTLTKAGLDILGTVPVIGEVEEGIRVASDVVRAGEKSIEAGTELTGVGMDYVKDTSELIKDTYNSFSNIFNTFWSKTKSNIESTENKINEEHQVGGKILSRTLDSIHEFNNNNLIQDTNKNNRDQRMNKKRINMTKKRMQKRCVKSKKNKEYL